MGVANVAIFLTFSVHFREKGLKSPMFAFLPTPNPLPCVLSYTEHYLLYFVLYFELDLDDSYRVDQSLLSAHSEPLP